jgi:hypothetical protein
MKQIPEFKGYSINENGEIWSNHTKRFLKQTTNRGGYKYVCLQNGKTAKKITVHRLVSLTYIENINNLPCINHINGIKSDNRLVNLEWCTYAHNTKHAFDMGLRKKEVSRNMLIAAIKVLNKKVINTINGEIYNSLTFVSKKDKISISYLSQMINGKRPNTTNYKYYEQGV